MEKIVLSIGGSVLFPKKPDSLYIKKVSSFLNNLSEKHKLFLVVGGGKTARKYIDLGRKLNLNEKKLDQIGIEITRLNAKMLSYFLEKSNKKIPETTDQALKIKKPVVLMGGTDPGHSTDMVAAELAFKSKADKLIIATNVDGIFDKDPNRFEDAELLDEVSIDTLIEKYGTKWEQAGKNTVVDPPALEIIKKGSINTIVLNGRDVDRLKKVVFEKKFKGTIIKN